MVQQVAVAASDADLDDSTEGPEATPDLLISVLRLQMRTAR